MLTRSFANPHEQDDVDYKTHITSEPSEHKNLSRDIAVLPFSSENACTLSSCVFLARARQRACDHICSDGTQNTSSLLPQRCALFWVTSVSGPMLHFMQAGRQQPHYKDRAGASIIGDLHLPAVSRVTHGVCITIRSRTD